MVTERTCKFAMYVVAGLMALGAFRPSQVSGQIVGATIAGTVMDSSGAVTPGVKIAITNVATGITQNAVTNGAGFYTAPNLIPGHYQLTAAAPGFKTQVRKGLILTVGQALVLNLTMQVGGVTQTVTVTGQAPTVNLANSTLGGLNNATTVEQLPLNGRSWTDLAVLQPGSHFVQDQPPLNAGDRARRGLGLGLTISGGRPQQNNYLLDGINIDDYANAGPGSLLAGNLGVDAVQEFTVLTANIGAEYGRTSAGVISAITKSGTNQFHGDAYEFLRNSALDARNFFDGTAIPPFRRNQFGVSAGGPIQKDKTFIFGDYEGIRQVLGTTFVNTVPSPAALAGNLSTGTVTVDPAGARFLKAFFPLPNGPISGDTGIFSFTNLQNTAENFFVIRADHTFSEKDMAHVTYMFDNTPQSADDEFKNKLINNLTRRQLVALEWNHVFAPQLMNSFRVGFNRDNAGAPEGATAINPAAADPSLGFEPGTSAGALNVTPLTGFSGGLVAASPFLFHWNSWQGYDNLFYTKGIHSMKFGANIERIEDNTFGENAPAGIFTFNSLSDFLTNRPASLLADTPGTDTPRGVRQTIFGAYFQDDVHFRSNLTVNLGLRYEMATIITEVQGKLSNLRQLTSAPPDPLNHTGSPYILNPTKLNFEPRVGFAWDPFKDGKTAVRGGFGVFDYLPLVLDMGSGIDSAWPFAASSSSGSLPAGSFPTAAYFDIAASHSYYIEQFNPSRDYILQWNVNLQRQLTPSTTATIGYVGSRGIHMWIQSDGANMVLPAQTPQGLEWPCPSFTPTLTPQDTTIQLCNQPGAGTVVNTFMGRTQLAAYGGDYFYNGLQVQINKVMSHGFQIGGSYTWAKDIDTGSGSGASDPYRNSISTLLPWCMKCRRSLSDTDIRHDLTVNYLWDIPTPASFGTPAKAILGNWEAGGILTMETGTPFTVLVAGDPLGMNNADPYQYPNRIAGPGCGSDVNPGNPNQYVKLQCFAAPNPSTLLGNEGRNSLIGPGLVNMDFSLSRNIPVKRISEAFNAQIRADFFNIFNRVNFTSPNDNRTIMNPDGSAVPFAGAFTMTNTTSRQIQFSLKLSW